MPVLFGLTSVVMLVSLLLGGGTRAGFSGDVVAQLLAIPLLATAFAAAFLRQHEHPTPRGAHWVILGGLLGVFLLQLIPLPPSVWSALSAAPLGPNTLSVDSTLDTPWRPLSLKPYATWAAAASLLPPVAIFLATTQLDRDARLRIVNILLVFGALSCLIGLLQVAHGGSSPLRMFGFSNDTEAVGFFANRNHFAALLYVTLVLASIWLVTAVTSATQPGALHTTAIFWLLAVAAIIVAVTVGLAGARSRAGVFLAMAALAGVGLVLLADRRASQTRNASSAAPSRRITLAILGFAGFFAALLGMQRILSRFDRDPLEDLRVALAGTTLEAAIQSLPLGTGIGSFVPIYAIAEKSQDLVPPYVNRAHNDFLEFFLEAGLLGALLMLAFLIWFIYVAAQAWLAPSTTANPRETALRRAATIVLALLLAHSLVDYPLRTTALSVIFAFCAATLVPLPRAQAHSALGRGDALSSGSGSAGNAQPTTSTVVPLPSSPPHHSAAQNRGASPKQTAQADETRHKVRKRWGDDVEWPEAWKKPEKAHRNS